MSTVDLLNVPVQLGTTLAQTLPDGAAGVFEVLRDMCRIPPGAGVHHGLVVALAVRQTQQYLSSTTLPS